MCDRCGCNDSKSIKIGKKHFHDHDHDHGHDHGDEKHGRLLELEIDVLAKNKEYAAQNRRLFKDGNIFCLNLMSSPGAGKTTFLTKTISLLKGEFPLAVIEGDQETDLDAERIRSLGVQALQINTGKGCHLDAHMVGHAIGDLALEKGSLLFIENVGNLVCPADFDLGEAKKVVILSTTEGEDKPIKYQNMFAGADVLVINKIDLLPYLSFDMERCLGYIKRINPEIRVFQVAATTGEGMESWKKWLISKHKK